MSFGSERTTSADVTSNVVSGVIGIAERTRTPHGVEMMDVATVKPPTA